MSFGIARGIEKVNKNHDARLLYTVPLSRREGRIPRRRPLKATLTCSSRTGPPWANPQTWVYAMGQAFFSLSVAGSGTVVYGSYLKSDVDIVSSAKYVAIF